MRIAEVVTTGSFAGTERYAVEVGAELARRGHDVLVVGGEPVVMQRIVVPPVTWAPGATPAEALRSLVKGGRRDIVHSHITKADFVALAAAPVVGGARISTRHITARRGYGAPAARLAKVVRWAMARELAVSQFVADAVESPVDTVILNGVEPVPDVTTGRERTVLVAQRLEGEKQTDVALAAWAAAGLGRQGWRLAIAGSGGQETALRAQAAALGVADDIDWLGWVDDLGARMRRAGILLAPAPAEPCGLTVLEAMAAGLPVVAPHSGGNPETLGQLPAAATFDPGDTAGAAAQLLRLVDDDAERERYGRALRELQRERLTLGRHVDQLETVYRQVTGSRSPR